MVDLLASVVSSITSFAIGGGGGSSSGGGGGGGGGFSGGGSYSSSGGSDGAFDPVSFFITIGVIVIIFVIIFKSGAAATKAIKLRRAHMQEELDLAAAADIVWEQGSLETRAKDVFIQYQQDWSTFNLDSMKTYMTPKYYQHNLLMMGALKLATRQNDVQGPTVTGVYILDMVDNLQDDSKDSYTIQVFYHVHDVLNDTKENTELFSQDLTGSEYYRFERSGKKWLFAGIDQETANPALLNRQLQTFAEENQYFYSLDWGHLLLPRRGVLFKSGSFGVSDINNHVIGLYKDIIIQMYTYIPTPNQATQSYLITQTSVPKSYGDIVVRRKQGIFGGGIKGLEKLKTEWGDFNSKYEVFANNEELATSFELLNPKFMEQLQALPFEINIEVVDNIIYLYAREMGIVIPDHYETMLEILKAAFKEMRM